MASPDTFRYRRIPLTHGSGAIPAIGFGTLIPGPLATKQATDTALEMRFRHLTCVERYRDKSGWYRDAETFKAEPLEIEPGVKSCIRARTH